MSNPKVRSLRPGEKKIDFNRDFTRKTTFADFSAAIFQQSFLRSLMTDITSAVFSLVFDDIHHFRQSLMTIFQDSHHFGSL